MEYRIEPLSLARAAEAAALEAEYFSDALSPDAFAAFALGTANHYYIACAPDERILGGGCIRIAADEAEIISVAVRKEFRRKGVARALMERMIADARLAGARSFYLEVRASNAAAAALYSTLGFCSYGVRKNYYTLPREDAILMAMHSGSEEIPEC